MTWRKLVQILTLVVVVMVIGARMVWRKLVRIFHGRRRYRRGHIRPPFICRN